MMTPVEATALVFAISVWMLLALAMALYLLVTVCSFRGPFTLKQQGIRVFTFVFSIMLIITALLLANELFGIMSGG